MECLAAIALCAHLQAVPPLVGGLGFDAAALGAAPLAETAAPLTGGLGADAALFSPELTAGATGALDAGALGAHLQAVPLPRPRPIECFGIEDRPPNTSYEHVIYFTFYKSTPPWRWERCETSPPYSTKNCVALGWTRPKVCG